MNEIIYILTNEAMPLDMSKSGRPAKSRATSARPECLNKCSDAVYGFLCLQKLMMQILLSINFTMPLITIV